MSAAIQTFLSCILPSSNSTEDSRRYVNGSLKAAPFQKTITYLEEGKGHRLGMGESVATPEGRIENDANF